jgi:beta-lactamase class D
MRHFLAAAVILFAFQAQAASWEENPEVSELFKSAGVNGTFVLYNVTAQTYIGHGEARAERRFVPASTFKIPNTLIGLSV